MWVLTPNTEILTGYITHYRRPFGGYRSENFKPFSLIERITGATKGVIKASS